MERQRLNLNIPTDTLARLDEYAKKMTISRTSAILVLVNMALDSQSAVSSLNELTELAKKIKE